MVGETKVQSQIALLRKRAYPNNKTQAFSFLECNGISLSYFRNIPSIRFPAKPGKKGTCYFTEKHLLSYVSLRNVTKCFRLITLQKTFRGLLNKVIVQKLIIIADSSKQQQNSDTEQAKLQNIQVPPLVCLGKAKLRNFLFM